MIDIIRGLLLEYQSSITVEERGDIKIRSFKDHLKSFILHIFTGKY